VECRLQVALPKELKMQARMAFLAGVAALACASVSVAAPAKRSARPPTPVLVQSIGEGADWATRIWKMPSGKLYQTQRSGGTISVTQVDVKGTGANTYYQGNSRYTVTNREAPPNGRFALVRELMVSDGQTAKTTVTRTDGPRKAFITNRSGGGSFHFRRIDFNASDGTSHAVLMDPDTGDVVKELK
jgi:hypothetical protein